MKALTTALLLIVTAFSAFGQNNTIELPSTTEEEYNYLTKGYRTQLESGLDMKKNYLFQDMGEEIVHGNYSFQLKSLIRESKSELVGILIITKSSVSGKVYYIGLPVNNKDLFQRYFNDINAWDEALTTSYSLVISAYLSGMTGMAHELEKRSKK